MQKKIRVSIFNLENFSISEEDACEDPCCSNYQGDRPESEFCVKKFAETLRHLKPRLQSYWSLHSYGQLLLFPRSYTDDLPKDLNKIVSLL